MSCVPHAVGCHLVPQALLLLAAAPLGLGSAAAEPAPPNDERGRVGVSASGRLGSGAVSAGAARTVTEREPLAAEPSSPSVDEVVDSAIDDIRNGFGAHADVVIAKVRAQVRAWHRSKLRVEYHAGMEPEAAAGPTSIEDLVNHALEVAFAQQIAAVDTSTGFWSDLLPETFPRKIRRVRARCAHYLPDFFEIRCDVPEGQLHRAEGEAEARCACIGPEDGPDFPV